MLSSTPPGSTTGNAFGTSRASFSVAGVGLPSVGTQAQPWPSDKPVQPNRLRRMAFQTPALQLLLTPYELPGASAGDCSVEEGTLHMISKRSWRCGHLPRMFWTSGVHSAGPVLRPEHASGPAPQRPGTPCCITCELLVVALSLQCFPYLPLVSEALAPLPVLFVYCLVGLL